MGKRKKLPLLEKVLISDIGSEGNAVARVDNMVLFVPMLIPGDVADIRVTRKKKKFMEGVVTRYHEYSKDRIEPRCSHFGICGGCKWQHLPYQRQLHYKEKQVADNLVRIGKTEIPSIRPIMPSPDEFYYRNKLEYTFSNRRWLSHEEVKSAAVIEQEKALGFHIPGLFDKVLDIDECHLQPEPTNRIRNAVRDYTLLHNIDYYDYREQSGFLRNLIVRNTLAGEVMVIVVFGADIPDIRQGLLDFITEKFPEITSLMYVVNPKRNDSIADIDVIPYRGKEYLTEKMDDLTFRIGPKSFFQTNSRQALNLYKVVREMTDLKGNEIVYDLYSGTGTIANFLAAKAGKLIGLEYIPEAVRDAMENSALNNIGNTSFFAGDIKDLLSSEFVSLYGSPDIIITDPPRTGMHADVVRSIIEASPSSIVYISCNPATQARDIQLLSDFYRIELVQPVDMFPMTHHVENVVLLRRL